jgi:hypothetical protein
VGLENVVPDANATVIVLPAVNAVPEVKSTVQVVFTPASGDVGVKETPETAAPAALSTTTGPTTAPIKASTAVAAKSFLARSGDSERSTERGT